MYDTLAIRGRLRIISHGEDRILSPAEVEREVFDGRAQVEYENHNLIVNNGLAAIAKFLGGAAGSPTVGGLGVASIADLVVNRMELGNAVSPPVVAATDTMSVVSLVYVPQLLVGYPTAYSIRFSGIVRHSEMNGTTFTEESLKMANGVVFAKVNGFAVLKQASKAKQFDHEIVMGRV